MTVAVVAIVRDEATRLPRMIGSLAGLVDRAVIVDTGSVDDTHDATVQSCAAHGIGLRWAERTWTDFGTNRTEALALARGEADWLLELDADQTVAWHRDLPAWLATDADADAYTITETEAGTTWRRPRLFRGDHPWVYVGATHEYLETAGRAVRDLFPESLSITHHADGSHRADKHHRDIGLLADGVTSGDPRAIYYTAQAYECLGEWVTARGLFDLRASMGGWEEEAWHAQYRAARCTLELGDTHRGVVELLNAYRRRPERAEPLAAIESWCTANRPATPPAGDHLFIETGAYDR